MLERLHALLRRARRRPAAAVGPPRLDPAASRPLLGDDPVPLTPTEFRLLAALAAARARPRDAATRSSRRWPHGAVVHENTLDVYVARLRRKLRDLPGAPRDHDGPRVGYRSVRRRRAPLGLRTRLVPRRGRVVAARSGR